MADAQEVSRRLKAARYLLGVPEKRKGKLRIRPLAPDELAKRAPLPENKLTANAISEFERMERIARPIELRALAQACGLPDHYFTAPLTTATTHEPSLADLDVRLRRIQEAVDANTAHLAQGNDANRTAADRLAEMERLLGEVHRRAQQPNGSTGQGTPGPDRREGAR